jgi:hypothetical protein
MISRSFFARVSARSRSENAPAGRPASTSGRGAGAAASVGVGAGGGSNVGGAGLGSGTGASFAVGFGGGAATTSFVAGFGGGAVATSIAAGFDGASIVDSAQPFAISHRRRIFGLCSRPYAVRRASTQLARAASSFSPPQLAASTDAAHGPNRSACDATNASFVVTGEQPTTISAAPATAAANLVTAEAFIWSRRAVDATVRKQFSYGIRTAIPDSGEVLYTKRE